MTDKFTVGSQWKCRNGSRAIVVKIDEDKDILVWHECDSKTHWHNMYGKYTSRGACKEDLVEPWKEPRKGEFWVNLYDKGDKIDCGFACKSKYSANNSPELIEGNLTVKDRIACIHLEWTEGEGLEDDR